MLIVLLACVPGSSLNQTSCRNAFGNNTSGKMFLANTANRCLPVFFLITPRKSICLFWTPSAPSFWFVSSSRLQILRSSLTKGLFVQGKDAILGSLMFIAIGLVVMYFVHFLCQLLVISWGHIGRVRLESKMREDLFDAYERMSFVLRPSRADLMQSPGIRLV